MKFKTIHYISWEPWFAWRPVVVQTCRDEENNLEIKKWVWWQIVERRREHNWADWKYQEIRNEKTTYGN
jgi:hypothetical protein